MPRTGRPRAVTFRSAPTAPVWLPTPSPKPRPLVGGVGTPVGGVCPVAELAASAATVSVEPMLGEAVTPARSRPRAPGTEATMVGVWVLVWLLRRLAPASDCAEAEAVGVFNSWRPAALTPLWLTPALTGLPEAPTLVELGRLVPFMPAAVDGMLKVMLAR